MTSDTGLRETLPTTARRLVAERVPFQKALEIIEREYLYGSLVIFKGNQSRSAKSMGMHRNTLSRMLKRYGIEVAGRYRQHRKLAA